MSKMTDRDKLIELFYENNVRCDQTIEHLVDDVVSIFEDLINCQQAEIEEWKKLVEVWQTISERDKAKIEYLARSNNMSQRLLFDAYDSVKRLDKLNETIKAEAIKEFEVKIHEKLHEAEMHGNFEPVVTREMFDSVIKEMVGEGK